MRFLLPALAATTLSAQPAVEQRMLKDLRFLAAPERQGRGNGSRELQEAARYLERAYRRLGLTTRIQEFPFVARIEREEAEIRIVKGDGVPLALTWGQDVEAFGSSADAQFRNKPLAFLGYGLQGEGYDDLAGLDLKGRVALMARKVPDIPAFRSLDPGRRSLLTRLHRLEQAGVAAVVILEEDGTTSRPLRREEGPTALRIPILSLPARALAPACGDLEARLQTIRDQGRPASLDFIQAPWTYMDLTLKLRRTEALLPNLVATLPGRDPKLKAEAIALGAHLDHLGRGERHSLGSEASRGQVHPGADDNASGTAMVLEVARRLAKERPRRSVVFFHFSGEEEGILGSSHWVKNPTQEIASVKFFANFDMVGRLSSEKPTLFLGGLGASRSTVERASRLAPAGLALGQDLGFAIGGSDHMSFAAARIPTFFFFTGIHGDYHRPTDTVERLNVPGMGTMAGYAEKVVRDLADGEQVPAFDPETAKLPVSNSRGALKVSFGTIPDFSDHPKGFRIQGTTPGSTAEAIGLKAGDVLLTFGPAPVKNIYEFMGALSACKPGDRVVVKWLRGDREMSAEAVLQARK